jgi:nitrous oxidase accessory protein NosD
MKRSEERKIYLRVRQNVDESDEPVDIYNVERADVSENESSYCRATMNRKQSEMDEDLERRAIRNFGKINKKNC